MPEYRAYLIQPVSEQVTFTAHAGDDLVELALNQATVNPTIGENWDLDGETEVHYIEEAATGRRVYGEGADQPETPVPPPASLPAWDVNSSELARLAEKHGLDDSRHPVWSAVMTVADLPQIVAALRAQSPAEAVTRIVSEAVIAACSVQAEQGGNAGHDSSIEGTGR